MKEPVPATGGWMRLGRVVPLAALGGFLALTLYAKWNPVQAQEEKRAAKKAAPAKNRKTTAQRPANRAKLDSAALARFIDEQIQLRLKEDGVKPSGRSDDAEFLRRVHLDLVGTIPTPERVEAFLADTRPNKRALLIDELLADARFGKYHAEVWTGLMLPRESMNRRFSHEPMQAWLAERFNKNAPLDKVVHELITASGAVSENGAVSYFLANNTVDKITDNVTRMFLGVQLQCAQCHNHPFTGWKQDEYWAMASFFMKVRPNTKNLNAAQKKGVTPGITEVPKAPNNKKGLPDSAKIVPAKFLQGESPKLDLNKPFRPVLANWMTSADNPFFARAMVNRWWYQLFGRGLVNPVDDMHEENGATHPELLDALTEQLKTSGFDLHHLVRAICNSEAYQRTSRPVEGNADDKDLFSHRLCRVLTPEQLYDSLTTVIGNRVQPAKGANRKGAANKKGAAGPREAFLAFFRVEEGYDPLEYQQGIPQALRLMNSNQLNATQGVVAQAMKAGSEPAKVIERLYLTALSRRPSAEETQRMLTYMKGQSDPRTAYGDILWVLINTSEFALNH